ncbi:ABC transporter G family member 21 [Hibiscus syriacus]|uniref:ABC transporter G family member 21 n=1 Tax=Hibiscus syriacus TaxID=106335 RepID=A0A6A3AIX7_HIBSY|nr:ABC transporter G family member 21 [Hibiscus syriacus]
MSFYVNIVYLLKFVDVVYLVKFRKGGNNFGKKTSSGEKVILNGISGMVQPGEILDMLGPSGSGKTKLLTALGGSLGGHLTSSITYNDKSFSNSMKRNTGFVTQDIVLYPHLTVTETLVFTVLLRLPNSFTKQDKIMHAEAIIDLLELVNCKDCIVVDPFLRGVSSGEQKRVSIGQEMLIKPSLLFIDEPTMSLDSTTTQRIVSMLLELAKAGRTIVLTIHQPSSVTSSNKSLNEQTLVKKTLVSAYKSNIVEKLKEELKDNDNNRHHDQTENKMFEWWWWTWWKQFNILLQRGLEERKHESFSIFNTGEVLSVAVLFLEYYGGNPILLTCNTKYESKLIFELSIQH